jgi:hypothetical protein
MDIETQITYYLWDLIFPGWWKCQCQCSGLDCLVVLQAVTFTINLGVTLQVHMGLQYRTQHRHVLFCPFKGTARLSERPWGLRRKPWSLGRWDHGFESGLRHGCLSSSFCFVLSCVGRGLCDQLITRPKESYQLSEIEHEISGVRRPRSLQGLKSHWWYYLPQTGCCLP